MFDVLGTIFVSLLGLAGVVMWRVDGHFDRFGRDTLAVFSFGQFIFAANRIARHLNWYDAERGIIIGGMTAGVMALIIINLIIIQWHDQHAEREIQRRALEIHQRRIDYMASRFSGNEGCG